jgi:hypothetical protein
MPLAVCLGGGNASPGSDAQIGGEQILQKTGGVLPADLVEPVPRQSDQGGLLAQQAVFLSRIGPCQRDRIPEDCSDGARSHQAENDFPHPQLPVAFGLRKTKPCPLKPLV